MSRSEGTCRGVEAGCPPCMTQCAKCARIDDIADAAKPTYLSWICFDCGARLGKMPDDHMATWHHGKCGWCGEVKPVTHPRDFGYPPAPEEVQE